MEKFTTGRTILNKQFADVNEQNLRRAFLNSNNNTK